MRPRFFRTQADLRAWFEKNHATATELLVGYYRKASGKPTVTWPDSVDEALCFGWIDGVRRKIDDDRYMNRFTPRRRGSTWSARNIKRAHELIEMGRMRPAGRAAFEARREDRSAIYSYEQGPAELPPAYQRSLKANKRAWEFWRASPPGYRKTTTLWVISAKREETRARRLTTLIETAARGERVPPLAGPQSARSRSPRRG